MACRAPRGAGIALAALTLIAACRESAEVVVTRAGDGAVFTVEASGEACVRSAYVYAEGGTRETPVWSTIDGRTARDAPCITSIRYGVTPEGFSTTPAPVLKAGQRYRVALVGGGFNASARFIAGQ